MLDMGFLPDIRRVLKYVPTRRQTLFFSATMPAPIVELTRGMLHNPATINLERKSAPAVGITQAIYPVAQELKSLLLLALLQRKLMKEALVFTRTKHRANRLPGSSSPNTGSSPLASTAIGRKANAPKRSPASRAARISRPRGHRHRGPRHQCRSAGPCGELRRPARPRGLHPSRGTDGARRADRQCLHLRVTGGRRKKSSKGIERAVGKSLPPRHAPRLRLLGQAHREASRCRSASAWRRSAPSVLRRGLSEG